MTYTKIRHNKNYGPKINPLQFILLMMVVTDDWFYDPVAVDDFTEVLYLSHAQL